MLEWLPVFTRIEVVQMLLNCWQYQHIEKILTRLRFAKCAHKADRENQFWQEGVYAEMVFVMILFVKS